MKPIEDIKDDIETIGEETIIKSSIKTEQLGHVFRILAGQYADPYGSIVRELTSNAYDANIESGSEKPVIVGFSSDLNNNQYFFVKDYGIGMDIKFMETTYMNWGESTKRNRNDVLGLFGIGSKSPLSIRNEYYITSVKNNIKYEYVIYKGDNDIPELDLLSQNEVNEQNGTIIKIYLQYDKYEFEIAIEKQLVFFSDVYYENTNIDNDFKIYDFKNFIYSSSSRSICICYKRVKYPINFSLLDVSPLDNISIGLKFNIGELRVTPSRESIEYKDKEKQIIKERLKDALLELVDLYNNQNFIIEDIDEYLLKLNSYRYDIDHYAVNISKIKNYLYDNYDIVVNLNNYQLKYFYDLGLITPNLELLKEVTSSLLKFEYILEKGKLYKKEDKLPKNVKFPEDSFYLRNLFLKSYNKQYDNVYGITPKVTNINNLINKKIIKGYLVSLNKNIKTYKKLIFVVTKYTDYEKRPLYNSYIIYKYVLSLIKNNINVYSKIQITENDLKFLNEKLEDDNLIKKTRSSFTLVYPNPARIKITWDIKYNSLDQFEKSNFNHNLKKYKTRLVLCPSLESCRVFNKISPYYYKSDYLKFIYINKKEYALRFLTKYDNVESLEDFTKSKTFANVVTSFIIEEKLKEQNLVLDDKTMVILDYINSDIYSKLKELIDFKNKHQILENKSFNNYKGEENLNEEFKQSCIELSKKLKFYNYEMLIKYKEIKKYLSSDELALLSIIDYKKVEKGTIALNILINHFKSLKKRVNIEYYNIKKWEEELVLESIEKQNYLQSIKN
jgi:hypothetical protein